MSKYSFEMIWDYFGVTLGSFWDHFGVTLGSFGGHSGIVLGSILHDFQKCPGVIFQHSPI